MSEHVELTPSERCVLLQTVDGASVQEVARSRAVSAHTVRTQIASIHRKLDVPTTALAMLWGIEHRECCLIHPWERVDDERDDAEAT